MVVLVVALARIVELGVTAAAGPPTATRPTAARGVPRVVRMLRLLFMTPPSRVACGAVRSGAWLPAASQPVERGAEADGEGGRRRSHCWREPDGALLDREPEDVGEDHWKISVVQSPPCRRTSWARAGPPGRWWRSTKKSRSSCMPPSGLQFTRRSQE